MASKWATPSSSSSSALPPLPRAPSAHSSSLLSLLNTPSADLKTPQADPSTTPPSRDEPFVYQGRDSEDGEGSGSGEERRKARTWSSGTEGSEGMKKEERENASPSSPSTERLFSSPEASPPQRRYSKHAPDNYVYRSPPSTSSSSSPSHHLGPSLVGARIRSLSPDASDHEVKNLSAVSRTSSDVRTRVQERLAQHAATTRTAIPPGFAAGTAVLKQVRAPSTPTLPSRPRHAFAPSNSSSAAPPPFSSSSSSDVLSASGRTVKPDALETAVYDSPRRQLKSAEWELHRSQQEREDLKAQLDKALKVAKDEASRAKLSQDHAQKAIVELQKEVEQLQHLVGEREKMLEAEREKVKEAEEKLKKAEEVRREAVREVCGLEDQEERRRVVQAVERGEWGRVFEEEREEKRVLEERVEGLKRVVEERVEEVKRVRYELKEVGEERDALKLAFADKVAALRVSHQETHDARAALSSSQDQHRRDVAHAVEGEETSRATVERLSDVLEAKVNAMLDLEEVRSELAWTQEHLDRVKIEKDAVEKELAQSKQDYAGKVAKFRTVFEKAEADKKQQVDALKSRISALEKEFLSVNSTPPSPLLNSPKPKQRFFSPQALLELSQSPLVEQSDAVFGAMKEIPLEISASKPEIWLADKMLPTQRLNKVEQHRHLLKNRNDHLANRVKSLETQNVLHLQESVALRRRTEDLEVELNEAFRLMQELMDETAEQQQAGQASNNISPSSSFSLLSASDARPPRSSSSSSRSSSTAGNGLVGSRTPTSLCAARKEGEESREEKERMEVARRMLEAVTESGGEGFLF
ncbi:hypothetical protein JCM8547_001894 [Rhodosporidiobolus lusitaniae]